MHDCFNLCLQNKQSFCDAKTGSDTRKQLAYKILDCFDIVDVIRLPLVEEKAQSYTVRRVANTVL